MARYDEDRGFGARGSAPMEQRLDRWVSAGRQLVDGVSGVRPGTRPRGPTQLGRWVEERFDWLLDDRDDWREPWQQAEPTPPRRRRSLEALSRRGSPVASSRAAIAEPVGPPAGAGADADWPEESNFSVPRWQRAAPAPRPMQDLAGPPPPATAPGRALPRSSRRRP